MFLGDGAADYLYRKGRYPDQPERPRLYPGRRQPRLRPIQQQTQHLREHQPPCRSTLQIRHSLAHGGQVRVYINMISSGEGLVGGKHCFHI